ncbi:hypothetical protein DER46DRAFT_639228 [Fusarium sp. MPI-SDFR-AT-0072]|nr:hypothetical protein DER46DRAFT_639228 [Fusarium sp. MPI-SDFR-AT-0072]
MYLKVLHQTTVSLRLISLERRVDKALAKLQAFNHSQIISLHQDSSRTWSLKHLLSKPSRFNNLEGSFVTSLRVSLPVETQNLPKDIDRTMGLHREVECMNHRQTQVREREGRHPLETYDHLQIPLILPREVVVYREQEDQYYQNISQLGHGPRCLPRTNNVRRNINYLRLILRVNPVHHTVNRAQQRIDIQLEEHHRVSGR